MRNIHVFDPQLTGLGGHYFNHDFQLLSEVKRRGFGAVLHGRQGCQLSECGGIAIKPVFSHDIFTELGRDPAVWAMENFHSLTQAFLTDLAAVDTSDFSCEDLLYFPNILQNQVYAITLWIASIPAKRRPAVALMFRYLNHAMDYVQVRQNKELIALYYRFAVRQLYATHPRCLICADTTELASAYKEIIGIPVLELPNPMDVSGIMGALQQSPGNHRPVVVYQGHTSPLRGFDFLPEIIDRCSRLKPKPRFLIQLQSDDEATRQGPLGPVIRRLEQQQGDDLRLVRGALSQEDYFKILAEGDIVLLPYKPSFYGRGSSGVFTEAASVGKVVVVSPNTVPARQGREYCLGVVVAKEWSPAAMADAVSQALGNLPNLKLASAAGATKFRKDNSSAAFLDKLLGAVERVLPKPPSN